MDQQFKKLQAQWYRKIKRLGFKDIEQDDGHLKDYSFNIAKGSAVRVHSDVVSARFEYYSACREVIATRENDYFFWAVPGSKGWWYNREIWKIHCEGISVNAIAKQVKLDRRRVRAVIQAIEEKIRGKK